MHAYAQVHTEGDRVADRERLRQRQWRRKPAADQPQRNRQLTGRRPRAGSTVRAGSGQRYIPGQRGVSTFGLTAKISVDSGPRPLAAAVRGCFLRAKSANPSPTAARSPSPASGRGLWSTNPLHRHNPQLRSQLPRQRRCGANRARYRNEARSLPAGRFFSVASSSFFLSPSVQSA